MVSERQGSSTSSKHGSRRAWWQEQEAEQPLNHKQEVQGELVVEQAM